VRNILISVPGKKEKLPLSVTHPELAKEADGWDPTQVSQGSSRKVLWKCGQSHRWLASIKGRAEGNGCPICSGRNVTTGLNDLNTTHPEIANQADGWDPRLVKSRSGKKLSWKCSLGHNWLATPDSRVGSNLNCPVCSNQKLLSGFNDLATRYPLIAAQAQGWDPSIIFPNDTKNRLWKCINGHAIKSSSAKLVNSKSGCTNCSGRTRTVNVNLNDLNTTHPEIANQADGWDPTSLSHGSGLKRNWICESGHRWNTSVTARTGKKRNCPYCSNQKLLKGFNDFATSFPALAKEAMGWDPTNVIGAGQKKLLWKCAEGHQFKVSILSRTSNKTGCPTCSKYGFDPNSEGWLYFLIHSNWQMFQIGITNVPEDRLKTHKRLGWEVIELRGPMDGYLTQQWETSILRMLKAKGADLSNSKIAGKFDGYSEAWSKSTFEAKSIKELMRLTEEFEEPKLED